MATFKCKMCDAILNVSETGVYECEYCGTRQTVVIDSNDVAAMFGGDSHNERRHDHKENESVSAGPLLKRAFMFLEDGDWHQAKQYCERALDADTENGRAYLGKLMADLQVRHEADLAEIAVDYRPYNNFEKAIRFGDPQMVEDLKGYSVEAAYKLAVKLMDSARLANDYRQAADQFRSVEGYKDSDELAGRCDWFFKEKTAEEKAKQVRISKEKRYDTIFSVISLIPTFVSLYGMSTLFNDVSYKKYIFAIFIMSAADVFGVAATRYLYYFISNKNKSYFWVFNIINILFSSISIFGILIWINHLSPGDLQVGVFFWKPFIAIIVCSIIAGFIGDRLGKRKAEGKSKRKTGKRPKNKGLL